MVTGLQVDLLKSGHHRTLRASSFAAQREVRAIETTASASALVVLKRLTVSDPVMSAVRRLNLRASTR